MAEMYFTMLGDANCAINYETLVENNNYYNVVCYHSPFSLSCASAL